MGSTANSQTRATLLERLRVCPTDQAAWNEFVEIYGPKIYGWCRRWRLAEADARDVTQEVLLKLAKEMCHFAYDPLQSFRAWLKTVTHHAWKDFEQSQKQLATGTGDSQVLELLSSVEAREDLEQRLAEAFDQELLEEATRRVRQRVAPQTWEAFRLLTQEPLSAREVAVRVGMQVAMVYVAKSKVQRMLREEVGKLEHGES